MISGWHIIIEAKPDPPLSDLTDKAQRYVNADPIWIESRHADLGLFRQWGMGSSPKKFWDHAGAIRQLPEEIRYIKQSTMGGIRVL